MGRRRWTARPLAESSAIHQRPHLSATGRAERGFVWRDFSRAHLQAWGFEGRRQEGAHLPWRSASLGPGMMWPCMDGVARVVVHKCHAMLSTSEQNVSLFLLSHMMGFLQGARTSTTQQRMARLSIVTEDPQQRRPRFHAPRASIAYAEVCSRQGWGGICLESYDPHQF